MEFLVKKIPWKQLSLETTFLGQKFLGNKIPCKKNSLE
jgi:hypothetical protein